MDGAATVASTSGTPARTVDGLGHPLPFVSARASCLLALLLRAGPRRYSIIES